MVSAWCERVLFDAYCWVGIAIIDDTPDIRAVIRGDLHPVVVAADRAGELGQEDEGEHGLGVDSFYELMVRGLYYELMVSSLCYELRANGTINF